MQLLIPIVPYAVVVVDVTPQEFAVIERVFREGVQVGSSYATTYREVDVPENYDFVVHSMPRPIIRRSLAVDSDSNPL